MSKHRNPRAKRQSNYTDLLSMARGRWPEILRAAGVPADALEGRRGRPCPKCGGRDRFAPIDVAERGAVICRRCFNGSSEPRCGDGIATLRWWLGVDAAEANRWLSGWLGIGPDVIIEPRPIERMLAIPEPKRDQFRLMADVCMRNMRPAYLRRAAELLGLPAQPLERLQVGWSPAHRACTWPMRDANGDVIGVRLRCPLTAKKWAVPGSSAGLFYSNDLLGIKRPKRLYVSEGPTDTAALMGVGLPVVGVPSAGGGRDLLVAFCRRVLPVEVVIFADVDGPGIDGAERLADALLIVAPVKVVGPATGHKDARAWVCAGADRLMIESTADVVAVRSIVMEGVSNE